MATPRSARQKLRPALVLWAAVLLAVPGCVVFESASTIETTPASDAVPPLQRLGRWNGTGFVPVAPGSVGPGLVTVLVHGWGHGLAPLDLHRHYAQVPKPGAISLDLVITTRR